MQALMHTRRPTSVVPRLSLLESIAVLLVVSYTKVELPVAPDHTSAWSCPLWDMSTCIALPRTIPPYFAASCCLLVTSPLHTDSRMMNSNYDFSIRLRTYPLHAEEKVLMLHGPEFQSRLGMAMNTPSSVYKPLHESFELAIPLTSVSFVQLFQLLCNTSHFTRSHFSPSALLSLSTVKFGCQHEEGEEEGVTTIGEGMVEEEVAVGEVGCDRKGRTVRMQMRLWLRRKGDGGQRLGRKATVKKMGSGCRFLLFFFYCCSKVAGKDRRWQQ
ncbi:hypothetical protein B296_00038259 [Ensete ventricosum]|uniref:BTB domain-containing protein n=1 Tax=Ensete ventricosum TaxID=4639 RepID=A0A426XQB4_ENSVE|nr:hypothetical protein B296_00038259 [Ensete ventricosum]